MADPGSRPYDIITFDCYGTLIDWETGIADAFRDAAAADGVRLDPAAAQRALRKKEPESQAAEYRSYRDVLTETAMVVADKLGWKLSRARAAFLPESLPSWKPFADTNAALTRLSQAGYELGILSNVDDDLLAGTRRRRATSRRRASASARGAGSTPPRATSTTSPRRSRTAFRSPGSTARPSPPPAPPVRTGSSGR